LLQQRSKHPREMVITPKASYLFIYIYICLYIYIIHIHIHTYIYIGLTPHNLTFPALFQVGPAGPKHEHSASSSHEVTSFKVRMVWGSFLIAAAALKTPTRNGYSAQGVNLTVSRLSRSVLPRPNTSTLRPVHMKLRSRT